VVSGSVISIDLGLLPKNFSYQLLITSDQKIIFNCWRFTDYWLL